MPYVGQFASGAAAFLNNSQGRNEHTLLDLLESLPGLIYIYDVVANRNIYVNASGIALLGYQLGDFEALGDNFLSSLIHPDDVQYWRDHVLPRYAAANDDTVIESEFRMRQADRQWRWFSTHERVWQRTADGAPQQIFAVGQDITARKESEHRLDRLLHYSTEGLSLIDAHGTVLYNSPTVHNMFGGRSNQADGLHFTDHVHPDDRCAIEAAFIGLAPGTTTTLF